MCVCVCVCVCVCAPSWKTIFCAGFSSGRPAVSTGALAVRSSPVFVFLGRIVHPTGSGVVFAHLLFFSFGQ
uniref:Uncharacterized protein n=1 Tax=Anopheles darlingi TaxID=43151 RepID=A0A2M4DN03_ANODA